MLHRVVFEEPGRFVGWPANNGAWSWANGELLVGFTMGGFAELPGHNIVEPYVNALARSQDGGETWRFELPDPFIGRAGPLIPLPAAIDFGAPGFGLRVVGTGYHGSSLPEGGFFVTLDHGRSWDGPHPFAGTVDLPALEGMDWTPRTDYVVEGRAACQVWASARQPGNWTSEKVFGLKTEDGGLSFDFLSWVVSPRDPYRAVMSATVRCSEGKLVTAVRRRDLDGDSDCWIDCYVSHNNGASWAYQSRVTDTGPENGNPPALIRLAYGQLCCAYGHRGRRHMAARLSSDEGEHWGQPIVLRDDFRADRYGDADLGYPRMVKRVDGKLVVIYYWATVERPWQHIAATIWSP